MDSALFLFSRSAICGLRRPDPIGVANSLFSKKAELRFGMSCERDVGVPVWLGNSGEMRLRRISALFLRPFASELESLPLLLLLLLTCPDCCWFPPSSCPCCPCCPCFAAGPPFKCCLPAAAAAVGFRMPPGGPDARLTATAVDLSALSPEECSPVAAPSR